MALGAFYEYGTVPGSIAGALASTGYSAWNSDSNNGFERAGLSDNYINRMPGDVTEDGWSSYFWSEYAVGLK